MFGFEFWETGMFSKEFGEGTIHTADRLLQAFIRYFI